MSFFNLFGQIKRRKKNQMDILPFCPFKAYHSDSDDVLDFTWICGKYEIRSLHFLMSTQIFVACTPSGDS